MALGLVLYTKTYIHITYHTSLSTVPLAHRLMLPHICDRQVYIASLHCKLCILHEGNLWKSMADPVIQKQFFKYMLYWLYIHINIYICIIYTIRKTILSVLAVHRPFCISICISTLPTQHTTFIIYIYVYNISSVPSYTNDLQRNACL